MTESNVILGLGASRAERERFAERNRPARFTCATCGDPFTSKDTVSWSLVVDDESGGTRHTVHERCAPEYLREERWSEANGLAVY